MTKADREEVDGNLARIGKLGLGMMALSHWDGDHYKGAIQLLSSGTTPFDPIFWILPNADFRNDALSLVIYLLVNGKVVLCADTSSLLFDNGHISLYRGTGSSRNDSGILLKVRDTVFSGDCDYKYWPDGLLLGCRYLKNLVVPHHGSAKHDISNLKNVLSGPSSHKHAYISVGKELNSGEKPCKSLHHSGHPSDAHIAALESLGFNVKCTKCIPSIINRHYYEINKL